jgi:hypothetical protein
VYDAKRWEIGKATKGTFGGEADRVRNLIRRAEEGALNCNKQIAQDDNSKSKAAKAPALLHCRQES